MSRDHREGHRRTRAGLMLGLALIVVGSLAREVFRRLATRGNGRKTCNGSVQLKREVQLESNSSSSDEHRGHSDKQRGLWDLFEEFEWLALATIAIILGLYAFKHMPAPPSDKEFR